MTPTASRVAFGWDLAGYGGSDSPLCVARLGQDAIEATVIKYEQVCSPNLKLPYDLNAVVSEERRLLEVCCGHGPFVVDTPIDLQSLSGVVNRLTPLVVNRYWQLVMRPIDFAMSGLTPLADNIGFPAARFANILRGLVGSQVVVLDRTLFETYPAACLDFLKETNHPLSFVFDKYRLVKTLGATKPQNWPAWIKKFASTLPEDTRQKSDPVVAAVLPALTVDATETADPSSRKLREDFEGYRLTISRQGKPSYKGGIVSWVGGRWSGSSVKDATLADLMHALGFVPATSDIPPVTDDDFDAAICSLVGVLLDCTSTRERLVKLIQKEVGTEYVGPLVPEGYRVLERLPAGQVIRLAVKTFDSCDEVCSFVKQVAEAASAPKVAVEPIAGCGLTVAGTQA